MTSSTQAPIIPITLTVNGRTGLTLWAPPWEDDEGEEWQGFLGDGAKIILYPNARELADFIASGEENDLSDHPGWGRILKLTPDDLRPEDGYDLDEVYELAAGEPDPVHLSSLANVVDMVAKIADCCDDGSLRRLIEGTPAYAELVEDEVSYHGKDGRKRWSELGDTIAETWERAITRVESWLTWRGEFDAEDATELESEELWDRIGAEPIRIVLPAATYLTVRAAIDDSDEVLFLGHQQQLIVFTAVADLARYCREAEHHELVSLQWWEELAEAEDDEFAPAEEYDLRKPSTKGAALLRELVTFCGIEAEDEDLADPIDRQSWTELLSELDPNLQIEG